jgi:hypothetical protein
MAQAFVMTTLEPWVGDRRALWVVLADTPDPAKHCLCPGSLPLVGQYARPRLTAAGIGTRPRAEQGAAEASG